MARGLDNLLGAQSSRKFVLTWAWISLLVSSNLNLYLPRSSVERTVFSAESFLQLSFSPLSSAAAGR